MSQTFQQRDVKSGGQCTCGHFLHSSSHIPLSSSSSGGSKGPHRSPSSSSPASNSRTAHHLETSFVHLPAFVYPQTVELDRKYAKKGTSNFLEMHQHLQELIRACQTGGDGVLLCSDCVSRVEKALDADSEHLENECFMYRQAARKEEERIESLEKALKTVPRSNLDPFAEENEDESDNIYINNSQGLQAAEQAFRDEIWALEEECRQQEAELMHLKGLRREQLQLADDLDEAHYELEVQRNALELEARAFNNDQEQLYQSLYGIQDEVDKLSSNISLPSLILDLHVDKERGLRYPLINELRLAYRPKGDIKWNEIQVAWSLAAQLLLVVGTLFHYPSEQWKIVPLSHCAKLIFFSVDSDGTATESVDDAKARHKRALVYHLGHPKTNGAKALKAWNALLHQVILHVKQKQEEEIQIGTMNASFPKLPFPISSHAVGTIDIDQLNENDDAGWSRAIHCMASNLLWLSDCASLYTSQQVVWTSAVFQTYRNN